MTEAMLNGDYSQRVVANVDGTPLSQICRNLNILADKLQLTDTPDNPHTETINSFIDIISSYANRNFTNKLVISQQNNILDAIATGINMLGEELQHSTVSKEELERERDQLKIAKEEAEKANRAKTVFLGNLSHEIRTPLQGIMGFAEVLALEKDPEKRLEYIGIIIRRANDLMRIIEELLDLSVIESGNVEAHPDSIPLETAIEKIFNDFREDYSNRNANAIQFFFHHHLDPGDIAILDPLHLRQVIRNLLDNSMKFTHKGKVELIVEKTAREYIVRVCDTGTGISPEKIKVIFEPFRQAHEGYTRPIDGIGLGLPICKKRVEMWGGTIDVESEPGKGSTFFFTIPVPRSI